MKDRDSDRLSREDAAARALAQTEFAHPLVLEAGAGTGKTSILVARIAVWAVGPGWERARRHLVSVAGGARDRAGEPDPDDVARRVFRRVAAITFTEAAAAEMAQRTAEALAELDAGRMPLAVAGEALPADRALVRTRARALLGALDQLQARTIHAFCRRLLAAHPFEARLHPDFAVDADERMRAEVVREVVEAALREAYVALDHPLVALAERGIGPTQVEEALAGLVAQAVPAGELERDPFDRRAVRALCDAVQQCCERVLSLARGRFDRGRTEKAREVLGALTRLRDASAEAGEAGVAPDRPFWGVAFGDDLLGRVKRWGRQDFTAAEARSLGGDAQRFAERARCLQGQLDHLKELDPGGHDLARRALAPLLARAERELRRRGAVGYAALLRLARDLLRDHPAVCAGERRALDQLLVDEFQDTDDLQCDLVRRLALEGPEAERPGLFLVGDPKQSIYGWRSADLDAYDRFVSEVLRAGGSRHYLSLNFRSLPVVLDEVERVIAPIMREQRGLQPAFQKLLACDARAAAAPFATGRAASVEHWVTWEWSAESGSPRAPKAGEAAESEARALAADLRALHAEGVAWREVGLLFRGSGDMEIYLRALRAASVPYAALRDRSFYQHREIIEAAALVRCVLDPNDHLALLTWLRSAAVGVPDAALIPLWRRELPRLAGELRGEESEASAPHGLLARLDALVEAASGGLPADVPGLARIAGWHRNLQVALRTLAHLRRSFRADPVDVFVEKLRDLSLLEAGEARRFLGSFRAANLDHFFRELTRGLDEGGDPQALLRRLRTGISEQSDREGRPGEVDGDAVHVMTMHRAKGLDFEHVYLLQLHQAAGAGASDRSAVEVDGRGGREYRIFGLPTPGFGEVRIQRARVEAAERVRTLYVAMTRAKTRLVMVGRRPTKAPPGPPELARSHAELLQFRRGPAVDLPEAMARLAGRGERALDLGGARWVFPALEAGAGLTRTPARSERLFSEQEVEAAAAALRERGAAASLRMARPFHATASADAHGDADAREAGRRAAPGRERTPGAREVAAAVGTLIHRVLEAIDWNGELDRELARQRGQLAGSVDAEVPPAQRDAVLARARELLDRIAGGRLLERLCALRENVVARELPVLLPPPDTGDEGAPVGFVSGALDLVYRDPDSSRIVVADYKTDAVPSLAAALERARHHASQGAVYQRAVREFLDLDYTPRFELWFLAADRVVQTPAPRHCASERRPVRKRSPA